MDSVLLEELVKLGTGSTELKRQIRELFRKNQIKNPVSDSWLQQKYILVEEQLARFYRQSEALRKPPEEKFARYLMAKFRDPKTIKQGA